MNGEKVTNSPCSTPRKLKFEQLRADYELFLQTFEKPTWIYRLLHRRHQISPFMLHRNLSYLKARSSRKNGSTKQQEKRKSFKIDNLLGVLLDKKANEEDESDCENKENYLNLSFGGFFHGPGFAEEMFQTSDPKLQSIFKDDFVQVSLNLVQVLNKRKKDKENVLESVHLGQCKAPWNPRTQLLLPGSSVQLSIPPATIQEGNKSIRTHILSFTVSLNVPKKKRKKKPGRKKVNNTLNDARAEEEPPTKRLRTNNSLPWTADDDDDSEIDALLENTTSASLTAELILYDRHKNCLLCDGDYELLLNLNDDDVTTQRRSNTFESKFENKLGPFAAFSFGPALKFNLQWSSTPSVPVKKKLYNKLQDVYTEPPQPLSESLSQNVDDVTTDQQSLQIKKQTSSARLPKVFYQFIYSNSTRQQTEAKEGTFCPWCNLNCATIYGLLRHLKCCHNRFSFLYTSLRKCHRIDVCVNEAFENSLGHDGIKDIGFIDIDGAPIKRKPCTEMLVARPFRFKEDLKDFMEPDIGDNDGMIPLKGHNRSYFHSLNNQHVADLSEFDPTTEDERAPDWLQEKTQDMIEEFTDVNKGEKMLMKMWNTHVLKNGYVADFAVSNGCLLFVEECGALLIKHNLIRNFLVHLNNLLEFQIISQSLIVSCMHKLCKPKSQENGVNEE